jgi:hypothetical protein
MEYKLLSRDLFSDLDMGIDLILKGKIAFLPERIRGLAQVRQLYEKTTEQSSTEVDS